MNHKKLVLLIMPFLLVSFVSAASTDYTINNDIGSFELTESYDSKSSVSTNYLARYIPEGGNFQQEIVAIVKVFDTKEDSSTTMHYNLDFYWSERIELYGQTIYKIVRSGYQTHQWTYENLIIEIGGSNSNGVTQAYLNKHPSDILSRDSIGYESSTWECRDGSKGEETSSPACKSVDTWLQYGKDVCENKCNEAQGMCGLYTFKVNTPCDSTDTISYSIKDTLTEGETKTYTLGAEDYEITVTAITDTGTRYVKFNINGESVKSLKEGEYATISDGNEIKVIEIIPNSAGDITQDLVEFTFSGKEQTQEEEPEEIDEDITGHLLVVDNKAPSSDVIIMTDLGVHLKYLGYDMASSRLNSEVTKNMLHNRVTTFIYLGEAVIIVGKNSPSVHDTLANIIEDFLEDEKDIKVKTKSSSEIKSDDLRDLFPKAVTEETEEELEVEILPPPIEKDECTSNQDCDDKNACTTDSCSGIPKKCSNTEISIGCNYNRKCIPIGIRVFNEYCDIDKEVYTQKGKEEPCNNNYECASNLCVNDQCVSPSLIQRIMNFFRGLVGNAIKIIY